MRAPPAFSADAHAWVDWLGAMLAAGAAHRVIEVSEPDEWRDPKGHTWRLVRTAHGIELRPGLQPPFLHFGGSSKVTALAIERTEVAVELTAEDTRWVDRFAHDAFDVAALAHAMLDERGLPHDNLPRLFPVRPSQAASLSPIPVEAPESRTEEAPGGPD